MFLSFENSCRCCLPNWQASHTPIISFSIKVTSPMPTYFDCIILSFWRLMWPIRLCDNSMSASALWPLVITADFILWESRINIRPSLQPRAIIRLHFLWRIPHHWTELACLVLLSSHPRPNLSFSTSEHGRYSWCRFDSLLRRTGRFPTCWMRWIVLSPISTQFVVRAFNVVKTNLYEMARDWMHLSRQTIHFLSWRIFSAWCCHRICSMLHHEHSTTIIVVGVWGVVGELLACEGRLTLLLASLFPIVAEFAMVST